MPLADDFRMKNEQHVSCGGFSGSETGSLQVNHRKAPGLAAAISIGLALVLSQAFYRD